MAFSPFALLPLYPSASAGSYEAEVSHNSRRSLSLSAGETEGENMAKGNHSFTEQDIRSRFGTIVGHTVAEVDTAGVLTASKASRNKGRIGAVIEQSVLGYPADSDRRPDIVIDGQPWEVKATGLVEAARGGWRAKEPMSITAVAPEGLGRERGRDGLYTAESLEGSEGRQAHEHRDRPHARRQDRQRYRRGTPSGIPIASWNGGANRGTSRSPSPLAELLGRQAQGSRGREIR